MSTGLMNPGTTALLPLDPAVSPEQLHRILPIRADLLPREVTAGRNARRTRILLAAAVVLVIILTGGWYVYADKQRDLAAEDLASVTGQVDSVRKKTKAKELTRVTGIIAERDEITADLKAALAKDLPWGTLLNSIRAAATRKGVTLTSVVGSLADDDTSGTTKKATTVGTLTIEGTAKNKTVVAGFLDALAGVDGVTDVYLTTAGEKSANSWDFTLSANIKTSYLCGRFSAKTCGGN